MNNVAIGRVMFASTFCVHTLWAVTRCRGILNIFLVTYFIIILEGN
jgi:hypothetical protein